MSGVQSLPIELRQLAAQLLGQRALLRFEAGAIERVADQRMTNVGQVHAHLVRAPGREPAFDSEATGA